ncbi:hypothetical protein Pmani_002779 [Petrolisthes manimaculis]|uniref:CCHC-type domain-containing protein n=1 Tax=Petrolisthes manimaculis TaxID=1843537 RepID=A0AAE1UK36_9EUCA|nr:hypothetical protein Pmani_002779 [Petrolisthes manimaculis]
MFDQARALESAQKDSESYSGNGAVYPRLLSAAHENDECELKYEMKPESPPVVSAASAKCYFCGQSRHPRSKCPARTAVCHKCQKMGHFSKVCRSPSASASVTISDRATLATITSAAAPGVLSKAVVSILVNGTKIDGLIDSGSSESFIHPDLVKQLSLDVQQSQSAVTLASTSFSAKATESTEVTQEYAPGPAQVGVEVSSLEQSPSSPPQHETSEEVPAPRRSTRVRRPPTRFEAC